MARLLVCLLATLIITEVVAYTIITLPGTLTFAAQPSPPKYTWKYTYTENGWQTIGWIQFASDPSRHGNYYDVDLYLNQYCKPYFYSRGYMCFGPTLTHYVGCPSVTYGLTNNDCADSPENMKRAKAAVDILFSTQFQAQFGSNVVLYDSFAAFGHSYGAFLMTAFAAVEPRITAAVVMSGGKKTYGTQYTDEYYATTTMPLLRVHGVNDSFVDPSMEDAENTILAKGGIRTFYLEFNNQNHAWVIGTVGGVMHDWYRTYDPRNNSAVIPVITGIAFNSGVVTLNGRGFGSNLGGWSSVLKNDVLPYTTVAGPYTWSDTQISFAADSVSSSYVVANADSSQYATGQVIQSFGGVFSVLDLAPTSSPVTQNTPTSVPVVQNTPSSAPVAQNGPTSQPVSVSPPQLDPPTVAPVNQPVAAPVTQPTSVDTPVNTPSSVDAPVDQPVSVEGPVSQPISVEVPMSNMPEYTSSPSTDDVNQRAPVGDRGKTSGSTAAYYQHYLAVLLCIILSLDI